MMEGFMVNKAVNCWDPCKLVGKAVSDQLRSELPFFDVGDLCEKSKLDLAFEMRTFEESDRLLEEFYQWGVANRGSQPAEHNEWHVDECASLERDNCDREVQHKRAKVVFHSQPSHFAAATGSSNTFTSSGSRCHNISHGSSGNEMVLYFDSSSKDDDDNNKRTGQSNGDEDDGDDLNTFEIESSGIKMDLTDDLLHMVFSFLNHIDLCRAARVCRQWRAASAHEDFWKCLNFENRNISLSQFRDICQRYPNAIEVNISGVPSVDSLVMETMSSLRNIEVLILGKGQLDDAFFLALSDCQALRKLSITDASLYHGTQDIAIYHDRLYQLEIIKCRVLRVTIRCPKLEILSLKRTSMAHAVLGCPQLLELDIASCHKLSDAGIRAAVSSCPLLSSLDISNCSCVSDETLREIALSCLDLHVLNASYCPNVSLESVRLPMLTELKLHNCEGVTSASMASIAHCYMLENLQLDFCNLLTSVSLDLLRLRNISLVYCRKLVDLNLRTPVLTSLSVSNCHALVRINITSNLLEKLVLQKQETLSFLSLQCMGLQEVDLTECESLTDSICEVFSDQRSCPSLRTLLLDNCESLEIVAFTSTSLVYLSFASCRGMTSLKLACPNLQQVFLGGCDHLEEAFFSPVGLHSLNLGICPKLSILQIEAPNMLVLELKGCGVLSEAIIKCPKLVSLDASFCSQLRDDFLSATTSSCPLIESLILMSCPSVGPSGLSSLQRLPSLTILDLSYTFLENLRPIFETCFHLKVLRLQACKCLANSSLDALYKGDALPSLYELDLSYGSICQSAIEELLACCTHLTHVSLNGCINMHDLIWGSDLSNQLFEMASVDRMLQNLNCVGCPNIKKVVIPFGSHCSHLSSLNLSLSSNLKEVNLSCSNLNFLNLSNCCSLEILKLNCPRLTSLFLQSCNIDEDIVEDAISGCSMLETLDIRYCPKIHAMGMMRLRLVCPSLKRIFSSLSP